MVRRTAGTLNVDLLKAELRTVHLHVGVPAYALWKGDAGSDAARTNVGCRGQLLSVEGERES